jgi:hypothetical protein
MNFTRRKALTVAGVWSGGIILPGLFKVPANDRRGNNPLAQKVTREAARIRLSTAPANVRLAQVAVLLELIASELEDSGLGKNIDAKLANGDFDPAAPLDPKVLSEISSRLKAVGLSLDANQLWPDKLEARQAALDFLKRKTAAGALRAVRRTLELPIPLSHAEARFTPASFAPGQCGNAFDKQAWCNTECSQAWYLRGLMVLMGGCCVMSVTGCCALAIAVASSLAALQATMSEEGCGPC